MAEEIIKVGFCVAYDWRLLRNSLPPVYPHADLICLSIDEERKSWGGVEYPFDEDEFKVFLEEVDTERKIKVLEGNFSSTDLTTRENCNLQRNEMAKAMGSGGWHVQVDSDEYFLDFKGFASYLRALESNPDGSKKSINVLVNLIPIYKRIDDSYFLVDFGNRLPEAAPFATNKPEYIRARNSGHFNHLSPFYALHETWSRDQEELEYKIANWGHASEELADRAQRKQELEQWVSVTEENYAEFKNIHPAKPHAWPSLKLVKAKSVSELVSKCSSASLPIGKLGLWLRNQRIVGKIRQITNL